MAVQTRLRPTTGALHTLIVDVEEERNLRYQYMYREGETVPPLATFQKSADMAEIQTLTNNLSRALACSPSDESDLRLWGGKIFDRIIPQQLSETFRRDARSSYLVLYLDPAFSWIPWELALRYYTQCAEWATRAGVVRHEIMTCNNMALVHLSQQDFEQARDLF